MDRLHQLVLMPRARNHGIGLIGGVDVAGLHTGRVDLEVQVGTERAAGGADVADDLAGLHGLAGPDTAMDCMCDDMLV